MSIVVRTQKQKVLDVLNSLEVIETNGGDDPYILVENSPENRKKLNDAGVIDEIINRYGDEETFCILALATDQNYANDYKEGKLVLNPNQYAVYENAYGELNFYDTYLEALAEYEEAKENILENDSTGEEEVYILEVKKVAKLVTDLECKEDPSKHGYDSWVKWVDNEQS